MVIETLKDSQQIIAINGEAHVVNIKEFESFLRHCAQFMPIENNGFETMVQIISDNLLDGAQPGVTVEELRPQLKFLREIAFLLKNITTPLLRSM